VLHNAPPGVRPFLQRIPFDTPMKSVIILHNARQRALSPEKEQLWPIPLFPYLSRHSRPQVPFTQVIIFRKFPLLDFRVTAVVIYGLPSAFSSVVSSLSFLPKSRPFSLINIVPLTTLFQCGCYFSPFFLQHSFFFILLPYRRENLSGCQLWFSFFPLYRRKLPLIVLLFRGTAITILPRYRSLFVFFFRGPVVPQAPLSIRSLFIHLLPFQMAGF